MNECTRLLDKNSPIEIVELEKFLAAIDFIPPADYIDFMKLHNGAEGAIGNNAYLNLWPIEELINLNTDLKVQLYAPGYFIFGSDGGGSAFAFNKSDSSTAEFALIGMLIEDNPWPRGATFHAFLKYLDQTCL